MPAEGPRVCSPLPASPYDSVLGSKLFPARCRRKGTGFAPLSPLALISPLWGANFFLLDAGSQAQGLLPSPFYPLFLRPGEQTFHCPAPAAPLLGRISAFLGPEVRAPKPILLALRVPGREPSRRTGRLSAFLGPEVRTRKPISLALRAPGREPRRRPGRLFLFFRPGVRARKPISLALRVPGREPSRRPGRLFNRKDRNPQRTSAPPGFRSLPYLSLLFLTFLYLTTILPICFFRCR